MPVLVAAVASVPAVFLSPLDGPVGVIGTLINWLSMLVLTSESVLLFWRSGDRVRWLRQHWWLVLVTVVTIPAVIFAVGPVQVLRLVRVVAAVQLLNVRKLFKVARVVRRRGSGFGRMRELLAGASVLLAVVLLVMLLVDPDSSARRLLDVGLDVWGWGPLLGLVVLIAVAAGATGALMHRRRTWTG